MKNPVIVYISGLFEDINKGLYPVIKNSLAKDGCDCSCIQLYKNSKDFGSYSFDIEIKRIDQEISNCKPNLIIAHSLGGYAAPQLQNDIPLILLDPSMSISEIINNNLQSVGDSYYYNDGETTTLLSNDFIESLSLATAIDQLAKSSKNKDICIIGAGKGGHKIAEKYKNNLPTAEYILINDADHNFSEVSVQNQILLTIKKRLGIDQDRC